MTYSKYLVKDTDVFVPYYFPAVEEDLDSIMASMATLPPTGRTDMLIAFCRDRLLPSEWVKVNPELAEVISSKSLPLANLEALFAACRTNASFREGLEAHITDRLRATALSVAP